MQEVPPKAYHQHIPHNPDDGETISTEEVTVGFFEKQITSIHNLMRANHQLPSFDSVRRAAEEVDGRFASKDFAADIPTFLQGRLPAYGERRILAVETVLCDLGYLTREELKAGMEQASNRETAVSGAPLPAQDSSYSPEIDPETYGVPCYRTGDLVQVMTDAKAGHIRTPVYLFGKKGTIARLQGMYLNPEDLAHFRPRVVKLPLYLVEFEMTEVWGDRCPPRSLKDKLRIEIYEPWLMPVN